MPVPDDVDDVTAAAIGNPGMSSWAALTERAHFQRGENVLINGATGVSGRLAIQIARHLGANKVIVTGRNATSIEGLAALGADVLIPLDAPASAFFGETKGPDPEMLKLIAPLATIQDAQMRMKIGKVIRILAA